MKVTTAMLADAAVVANGKLFVHGGAWDVINTAALPATHPTLAVVIVIEFDWSETHVNRNLHIQLHDEDDQPLDVGAIGNLTMGHPPGAIHGSPIVQPIALQFPAVTFPQAGRYYFRVALDEKELARVRFSVQLRPPLPMVPAPPGVAGVGE